jgi:hypothetical protein
VASTDQLACLVDRIQYQLSEGPCVDAAEKGSILHTGTLETDPRWPRFGPEAAVASGMHSMLSMRMVLEPDDAAAALNIYSTRHDAFSTESITVANLLALHGALAVSRLVARQKAANLEIALESSREIGMAMGVLMSAYKLTSNESFDLLRIVSQGTHRKLRDVARDVTETGTLEMPEPKTRRTGGT